MNASSLIASLERFPRVLAAIVDGTSDDELRWKPGDASGGWSILEVLCHLADEEVEDFRTRLKLTLEDPSQPWPPINPEQAAADRRYNEQNPRQTLERFTREREQSVRWLRTLSQPDWNIAHQHPKVGPIRAGDLLVSWGAHDALHLRQIAKRLFQMAERAGAADGFSTRYAGEWGP